jgi:prepilin-type N-terminal cleavage/methylation domain-containing protein
MIIVLRRRLTVARDDAGMSLVELLVSIIVFGILGSMVLSLWLAANKSVVSTSGNDLNTQAAGNLISEVSRVVRGGATNAITGGNQSAAFVSATPSSITMYSYVDSDPVTTTPVLVQFTINATTGQLQEKRWPAIVGTTGLFTFNQANTPTLSRTLPGRITSASQSTLFTYYQAGSATPLAFTSGALLPAQLALVDSVTVSVTLQASSNTTIQPATLSNTVGMPNLNLGTN